MKLRAATFASMAVVTAAVIIGGMTDASRTWLSIEDRPTIDDARSSDPNVQSDDALTPPSEGPAPAAPETARHQVRVERGDTLAVILGRFDVLPEDAAAAFTALADVFDPRHLKVGQIVDIGLEALAGAAGGHRLQQLILTPDPLSEIRVAREAAGVFAAEVIETPTHRSLATANGKIDSNLFSAGGKAGVPDSVLVEMIRIYSWDVDFQRDIQPGDSFELMYERVEDTSGRMVMTGDIHFAALTLGGVRKPLYRFTRGDGDADFFDPKGNSARKALLRTPVDGARLSSGYGMRRHPILGFNRMHRGVDFAAPMGTPIYAAGDGTVEVAGRKGGYGKYVRIRHNGAFKTAYAHMRGIARGISPGKRVRQGQVIGYVGNTGSSTGPHLHYEIHRDAKQVNPLKVKVEAGPRLEGQELEQFLGVVTQVDAAYHSLGQPLKVAASASAN